MGSMGLRRSIHDLVDEVADEELPGIKGLLDRYRSDGLDPILKDLAHIPYDDEPTTPEEDASCKEAWEEHKRGEGIPLEDLERELDL